MNRPTVTRRAFTLVELLTVIVIIGILAGLVAAVSMRARLTARNAAVSTDISQIEQALEVYAQQVGEYPPDFSDQTRVLAHLRKRWPDYPGSANWATFKADVQNGCGLNVDQIDRATALIFWLAGTPPDATTSPARKKPQGFSADPANPFRAGVPRTKPSYDFNADRLFAESGGSGWWEYRAPHVDAAPLVYFRARAGAAPQDAYRVSAGGNPISYTHSTAGVAVPYLAGGGAAWRNERSFQIISCGFDGRYGDAVGLRQSQTGAGCTEYDYDNHANFSKGMIGDEIR